MADQKATPEALISIHDVMPDTMSRVRAILERLNSDGHCGITLLVVPGLDWQSEQIEQLRAWQEAGHELAAHGWKHRIDHLGGLYHRLHSALISRDVAEHLSLNRDGVLQLMRDSHAWFAEHGLRPPRSYVPPAWALGAVRLSDLQALPFGCVETTSQLLIPSTQQVIRLPLVGFEADTRFRASFLSLWNHLQLRLSLRLGRPLRISIHPYDPELQAADQLLDMLARPWRNRSYSEFAADH